MGTKRKFAYRDPHEDEYVFHNLVNYPGWARDTLSPRENAIFNSEKSIRRYVNTASGDQKRILLAKANIRFVSLYLDFNREEPLNLINFNKIYKSYATSEARRKVIDQIYDGNTFAISSREALSAAYLIAQNCHTPYYYLNQDYRRVYTAIEGVRMKNLRSYEASTDTQDLKQHAEQMDVCANFYLACHRVADTVRKSHLKLDLVDMRILVFLYVHRAGFVRKTAIQDFLFDYNRLSIAKKLALMLSGGMIDINRGADARSPSYTIAELGLIAVHDMLEKITQNAIKI